MTINRQIYPSQPPPPDIPTPADLASSYPVPSTRSSSSSSSSSSTPRSSLYPTTLRVLTGIQNTSALVFSVFVGVHLAGPIAAGFGGTALANKALLVGRAYYHASEPILIYLPLTLHLSSSLLKRLLITLRTRHPPQLTSHRITAYILPFLLIPHLYSHRIIPQSSDYPISNLSPSELDYDFPAWSMYVNPVRSTISYLALVGVGSWHAGVGLMKIVTWIRGPRPVRGEKEVKVVQQDGEQPRRVGVSRKRKVGLRGLMVLFVGWVGVGLYRLYGEGKSVGTVMGKRYEAVYARFPGLSVR